MGDRVKENVKTLNEIHGMMEPEYIIMAGDKAFSGATLMALMDISKSLAVIADKITEEKDDQLS